MKLRYSPWTDISSQATMIWVFFRVTNCLKTALAWIQSLGSTVHYGICHWILDLSSHVWGNWIRRNFSSMTTRIESAKIELIRLPFCLAPERVYPAFLRRNFYCFIVFAKSSKQHLQHVPGASIVKWLDKRESFYKTNWYEPFGASLPRPINNSFRVKFRK